MSAPDEMRRGALEQRIRLAEQDLSDLAEQVEAGEIDDATAADLEQRYRDDLAAARQELDEMPKAPVLKARERAARPKPEAEKTPDGDDRPAWLIPVVAGVVMVVVTVAIVLLATGGEDPPATQPTAAGQDAGGSLAEMEAAVAAQPANNPMRLALANAYFEQGDFMNAMNHYSSVTANEPTDGEAAVANARIGWMAWAALDDPQTALSFLDAAIDLDPEYGEAVLWKGIVLLYGMEDGEGAIPLFERVLELPDLPDVLRPDVENMLAEARGGGQ